MSDQEKENVAKILRLAKGYIGEAKANAVANSEFDKSMRIASNEAKVESYFRERGIEVEEAP